MGSKLLVFGLVARLVAIAASFAIWFYSQKLIDRSKGARFFKIKNDPSHRLTAGLNAWIGARKSVSRALLVSSSLGVDLLVLYVLWLSLMGPSFLPFIGLIVIFALRQICQFYIKLEAPAGMIWFDPGLPSLFVTYGVANDFFFSGSVSAFNWSIRSLLDFSISIVGNLSITPPAP